jgi:DNA modification methylase
MTIKNYLNKVFQRDVMAMLKELPDKCVDMVYGDPDYNVGVKYGDKTYTRNFDEYIEWYIELARESLRVLKDTGNMFFINYPKQNAYLRAKYLDQACYEVLDYVWVYNTNVGHSPKRFTTAHRSVLHCRKTENNNFYKDNVAEPYKNPTDRRIRNNLANGSKGRMPYDWLYFDLVKNVSCEKTFHACQIPQALSELLVKSCTKPKDIVLVLFGGSGAEVEVCKNLRRQFISAEIDPKYHKIIIDRLKNGGVPKKHRLLTYMKEKQTANINQATLFSR